MAAKPPDVVKIAMVGPSGAGSKSCLVHRFVYGRYQDMPATVGTAFYAKTIDIDGRSIKLEIIGLYPHTDELH